MIRHRPTAVVFDLGKVLVDFDYSLVVRRIAARSPVSVESLQRMIAEWPLLAAYERGELNSEDFYRAVARETEYSGSFEEFAALFGDIFTEIPPMISLQARLKEAGIPTFIFSNTNDLAVQHIRRSFPLFSGFDGYVLSFEHGSMKPDSPLYEVVERMTGRSGSDLLYLDDRPENIEAGRNRGWQTILHQDPGMTRRLVMATGLLEET